MKGETTARNPGIEIRRHQDLSDVGQITLRLAVLREFRWPQIEHAIAGALMFYNSLGPLLLACKRTNPTDAIPSAVQFLLIQHYEFNQLIQRYVMSERSKLPALSALYEKALKEGSLGPHGTFTAGFATTVFRTFIREYYPGIKRCFELVTSVQLLYWQQRHPYLLAHFNLHPPLFADEDWFPRFYFDEFEHETKHINLGFFADLDMRTYTELSQWD